MTSTVIGSSSASQPRCQPARTGSVTIATSVVAERPQVAGRLALRLAVVEPDPRDALAGVAFDHDDRDAARL